MIGLEWEAKDVGQGPMKMFEQTICEQQRFCAPGVGWSCLFDGAHTAGLAVGRYWNAGAQGRASGLMIRSPKSATWLGSGPRRMPSLPTP